MPDEVKVSELNVDEVLELVGLDEELAAQALEAEKASDHPRSTLIQGLEAVLAPDEPDEPDVDDSSDDGPGEGVPDEPSDEESEDGDDEVAPSDFRPSNQDLAQNAMVSGAQALEERKREQIRANRNG